MNHMENTEYLSVEEVQAAQTLHKRAPYSIAGISTGFFSIARHYGGMTFQGCKYTYMHGHDECVRDDVLKLVSKMRKKKTAKIEPAAHQNTIFHVGNKDHQ